MSNGKIQKRATSTLKYDKPHSHVIATPKKPVVDENSRRYGKAPFWFHKIPEGDPLRDLALAINDDVPYLNQKVPWKDVIPESEIYPEGYRKTGMLPYFPAFKKDVFQRCVDMLTFEHARDKVHHRIDLGENTKDKFRYRAYFVGCQDLNSFDVVVLRYGTKSQETNEPTVRMTFRVNRERDGSARGYFWFDKKSGAKLGSESFYMRLAVSRMLDGLLNNEDWQRRKAAQSK